MLTRIRPFYLLALFTLVMACGDSTPTEATPQNQAAHTAAPEAAPAAPAVAQEPEPVADPIEEFDLSKALPAQVRLFKKSWTGDFDGMAERRVIRVLTVYGIGRYYLDGPKERGLVYEMFKQFEKSVNDSLDSGHVKVHVVFVPVVRSQLIPALLAGHGDIIAAGLTITPERQSEVAFSNPVSKPVTEILVTGPTAPAIKTIDDLAGQTVYLRLSSSYRESVEALNKRFEAAGKPPIKIEPMSEILEDDDLIEMVNTGLLPWAIVDGYKPQMWEGVFDKLVVRNDIVFRSKARIAYAFRKDSPKFAAVINKFVKSHKQGTLLGNMLSNRYLRDFDWAANALEQSDYQRFLDLQHIFKTYGEQYGIEYLFAAAQGFQESRLDQSARSHAGAVGVMQLLPSTAAGKHVGIPDIHEVEDNIHAGVKYMDFLRDRYFSDPDITPLNGALLALGAYNAGPARMISLRRQAEEAGYDPNVWFDNVELIAAREIGRETVQYVANVYKYYLAYRLSAEQRLLHKDAREDAGID